MSLANRLHNVRGRRPSGKALTVAVVVGVVLVGLAWWFGPGLFGASDTTAESRVVRATITEPVPCTETAGQERVRFTLDGAERDGVLRACGHDTKEQVRVAVPDEAGGGLLTVHTAVSSTGYSALRVPVGLLLLLLSCAAGGLYAFLVVRGPRRASAVS